MSKVARHQASPSEDPRKTVRQAGACRTAACDQFPRKQIGPGSFGFAVKRPRLFAVPRRTTVEGHHRQQKSLVSEIANARRPRSRCENLDEVQKLFCRYPDATTRSATASPHDENVRRGRLERHPRRDSAPLTPIACQAESYSASGVLLAAIEPEAQRTAPVSARTIRPQPSSSFISATKQLA